MLLRVTVRKKANVEYNRGGENKMLRAAAISRVLRFFFLVFYLV